MYSIDPSEITTKVLNQTVDAGHDDFERILQFVKKLFWSIRDSILVLVLLDGMCCLVHMFYRRVERISAYYSQPVVIETTRFGSICRTVQNALFGALIFVILLIS